jgi:pyrroline-5-carboxylate reductase
MSNQALTQKITFIGGGQMAEALIGGLLAAQLCRPDHLWATDPVAARLEHLKRQYGILVGGHNREAAAWADVVVLAVKPQILESVLQEIGGVLKDRLIVSVIAGAPIKRIADGCGGAARIIRTMPNQPAAVREGMTALTAGAGVGEGDLSCTRRMFESIGKVVPVEERLMDAVTGLSGSGPAYVFLAIEALSDGGVKMGLPRDTALLLAAQTVLGAARMVLETGQHPARLKDQVTSPGGTTIAGLHQLEQSGLRGVLINAVEAATKRSQELGR